MVNTNIVAPPPKLPKESKTSNYYYIIPHHHYYYVALKLISECMKHYTCTSVASNDGWVIRPLPKFLVRQIKVRTQRTRGKTRTIAGSMKCVQGITHTVLQLGGPYQGEDPSTVVSV